MLSRRNRGTSTTSAAATGALMKKIQGQLRYDVRTPPRSTPTAAPLSGRCAPDPERSVAVAALGEGRHQQGEAGGREQRPAETLQRAEATSELCRARRGRRAGNSSRTRARPVMKSPTPAEADRQPSIQEQRPAEEDRVGRSRPCEARLVEKPRSDLIDGSATFTIATSRITMNWAVTMSASAAPAAGPSDSV